MYLENLNYMIPEIFLSGSAIILLVYGVLERRNINSLYIITMLFTLFLLFETYEIEGGAIWYQNKSGVIIKSIILITGIIVQGLSLKITKKVEEKLRDYELGLLIILSIIGMFILISSRDLILTYLGIEILSLSLYILASIRKGGQYSTEAGLKYLILGALGSGLYLFGSSLIYLVTGLTDYNSLSFLGSGQQELGCLFILMSLLFKLGAAPFHMWAPDVYEGSSSIITAYFAIVPKISILGLLINLTFDPFLAIFEHSLQPVLLLSGVLSIGIGSIAAINQTKIKRLLAYSAIAHIGWVLLGIGVGTLISIQSSLIYIILYILMAINSFSIVLLLFKGHGNNYIIELNGLSRKEPLLALTFSLCLLSIAGIPPLAGFFSKYNVLLSLIDSGYIVVSLISIILAVIGSFYYIRIIQLMYFSKPVVISQYYNKSVYNSIIIGGTLYLLLTYLIYPNPLLILTFDIVNDLIW